MSEIKNNDWGSNLVIAVSILATSILIYLAILGNTPVAYTGAVNSANETLADRIRPVVTLDDILNADETVVQAETTEVATKTPADLYQAACMACHTTGVANAPKLGDNAVWATRAGLGLEGLLQSAIKGKGAMPPKGASTYSDEELRSVIEYMLTEANL
ncbi:MAG: cytochrome c5 family protein [Gammaproteobacteria bacterium]|nr:cytochrome c5 family protein [Gammaproteobacteria bacterium]